LYVAMTRAKEKLICVSTVSTLEKAVQKALEILRPDGTLSPQRLVRAGSYQEWLLACLLRHPSCGKLRKMAGAEDVSTLPTEYAVQLNVIKAQNIEVKNKKIQEEVQVKRSLPLLKEIQKRIDFTYPLESSIYIPSKRAVSELAEQEVHQTQSVKKPDFAQGKVFSPAQKGTILHKFMQIANFNNLCSTTDIENEIERLVQQKYLLEEEKNTIDMEKIFQFSRTSIFSRISKAEQVWRELRFNLLITQKELEILFPNDEKGLATSLIDGSEKIVLQGMADLVFKENEHYYILDYKTDHANAETLRQRYTDQLKLYARAVTQIFHRPVDACYLYGFAYGNLIEIS
ncbi:MAG TPA: hypothetical protein DEP42_00295, partial [Ruminococcaceae bacterium]|nr:hypothetical protein [Oscillospiraceae bacterium]